MWRWGCIASKVSQMYQQFATWTKIQLQTNIEIIQIQHINVYMFYSNGINNGTLIPAHVKMILDK